MGKMNETWEVWRYKNAAGREVAGLKGEWTDPQTGRTHGFEVHNIKVDVAERLARRLRIAADLEALEDPQSGLSPLEHDPPPGPLSAGASRSSWTDGRGRDERAPTAPAPHR